jgi:lipoate-protein ligase A
MNHIELGTHSPYENLAAEEYLLLRDEQDWFMLWQNAASVIIGCHQNAYAEVNTALAEQKGVCIARRMTGGGAVYHDLGNINFSLIINTDGSGSENPYQTLCQPLVETLRQCGAQAALGGRNDLLCGGRKIAGCAIRRLKNRALIHGAMLYNTDLSALSMLLTPHSSKFSDKAVKSVSSRVANAVDLMPQPLPLHDFMTKWQTNAIKIFGGAMSRLTEQQQSGIADTARRYADPEWIYGNTMPSAFGRIGRTSAGNVEVQMNFDGGRIDSIRIYGDFFAYSPIAELEKRIAGCKYDILSVRALLSGIDLQQYISGIQTEELLELMF